MVTHSFAVSDEETGMIILSRTESIMERDQPMRKTNLVSQVALWVEEIIADGPIELVDVEYVKEAHGLGAMLFWINLGD